MWIFFRHILKYPYVLEWCVVCYFFFASLASIFHGFPLVDIYADESYYVSGPLYALSNTILLPQSVPYGTITYFLVLPLQAFFLAILWIFSGLQYTVAMTWLFDKPYLAYIVPRALHFAFYCFMLVFTLRNWGPRSAFPRPYALFLSLIAFSNLTFFIFSHSGKMWITSVTFLFFSIAYIQRHPLFSMILASLAFANFHMMGVFWLLTMLWTVAHARHRRPRILLLLVALCIPAIFIALNANNFFDQIRVIVVGYILPIASSPLSGAHGFSKIFILYISTLWSYILKILTTSTPFVCVIIFAFFTAKIRDHSLFRFSLLSYFSYIFAISTIFYSARMDEFLRYLLPLHVIEILVIFSLEFRRSRYIRAALAFITFFSVSSIVMITFSSALPTTYAITQNQILQNYSGVPTVIISQVSQLSFPLSATAAKIIRDVAPDLCAHRCQNAITHQIDLPFDIAYFSRALTAEEEKRLSKIFSGKRIEVFPDSDDTTFDSVEHGLGSYFRSSAWMPRTLGQRVLLHVYDMDGGASQ